MCTSANNASRWRNKPCSHDVIDCLTRYRTRPGTVNGAKVAERVTTMTRGGRGDLGGEWGEGLFGGAETKRTQCLRTVSLIITLIMMTAYDNTRSLKRVLSNAHYIFFVLTLQWLNDGDRSGLRRGVCGMRRRAEDGADGHGGGGAGGSGVVRRSSCSRPDITGRNPVPAKRSSHRDRGAARLRNEINAKTKIEIN